jgi:hypothetical protein
MATTTFSQGVAALNAPIAALGAALAAAGPLSQVANTAPLVALCTAAIQAVTTFLDTIPANQSAMVAATLQLRSQLACIQKNILNGQAPRTITTKGGSFYDLAAQWYGDVTQAFPLAMVNGFPTTLVDPTILETIVLPPFGSMTRS